ncbi:MAG TPA: hypothetical protein VHX17_02135 [Candidatus Cybelea sp.]|nr:hypothetical protein [Candidatus Cybelea sp.]
MANARGRMERATLGSVVIHCLVALAIPALAFTVADTPAVETVSFTHILHVQIVRPQRPMPRPRAAAPHFKATPTIDPTHKVTLVKLQLRGRSAKAPPATNAPAAPTVAAVAHAGDSASHGTTEPVSTASPQVREVASENARPAGGYLPFGAEQPTPVLDPQVRKQLDSLGAHVTLVVTVGDDGKMTNLVFTPPVDSQTETKIRSLLADASWDPAVCGGGVSCEGQATIKL